MIIPRAIAPPTAYAGFDISENRKEDECEDKADYDVHGIVLPSMIAVLYTQPIVRVAGADLPPMGCAIRTSRGRLGNIVTHVFHAANARSDRRPPRPRPLFSRSGLQTFLCEIRSLGNDGG